VPAPKTVDAVKLVLRLPKRLHRRLVQRAKRNNISLNTEIITELEKYSERFAVPLTEVGLFSEEFSAKRRELGHPPLSIGAALDLFQRSKKEGISPEEILTRELQKRGIDPDAPYEPPAAASEQDEK
jgi:HicB-like protein involved in pilus formation